jgi:uncharacterized protein YeaC (DUF1315 family)
MNIRKDSGLTLIGFLIVLSVGLFFAYTAMRLIPMYLEYHALTNALEVLQKDPQAAKMSPSQIKTKIRMSLWASYADNNIKKEHMRISKKPEGINVKVKYEVRKPFLGNIDIIAKFERSVILRK